MSHMHIPRLPSPCDVMESPFRERGSKLSRALTQGTVPSHTFSEPWAELVLGGGGGTGKSVLLTSTSGMSSTGDMWEAVLWNNVDSVKSHMGNQHKDFRVRLCMCAEHTGWVCVILSKSSLFPMGCISTDISMMTNSKTNIPPWMRFLSSTHQSGFHTALLKFFLAVRKQERACEQLKVTPGRTHWMWAQHGEPPTVAWHLHSAKQFPMYAYMHSRSNRESCTQSLWGRLLSLFHRSREWGVQLMWQGSKGVRTWTLYLSPSNPMILTGDGQIV